MYARLRHAEGSLPSVQPSSADLSSLPLPHTTATLLFVVSFAAGVAAGEVVFELAQLRTLDMEIKAKALQVTLTAAAYEFQCSKELSLL